MRMRTARHVTALEPMRYFYVHLLEMREIGGFVDHNGYDGMILGSPEGNWQVEFTVSQDKPEHHFDEDDLIVLYYEAAKYDAVIEKLTAENYVTFIPKNPYWVAYGNLYKDPEGFGVMVVNESKMDR